MIADCHMHTEFSTDCTIPMEQQIEQAIKLGIPHICLTDHYDMDFPTGEFQLDTDAYMKKIRQMQETYQGQISVGFGVELGLQESLEDRIREYTRSYPFDYVIGSMHLLDGYDPYHGEIFQLYGTEETFRRYFQATAEMLKKDMDIDTLAHMDYVVRYGDYTRYSYRAYGDEIDTILRRLIEKGIALEVNTGGQRKTPYPNPHPDVLKRYRELGGERITVGSDSHFPEHVGYAFCEIQEVLKNSGFSYYTVYKQREPRFIKI